MSSTTQRFGCSETMETFHRVLDGGLMDAADRTRMESHLAVCSGCAENAAQLREMQDLLRGIAEVPMPDDAFQHVRARTVETSVESRSRRAFDWRFAAAAAVVVFATWIGANWWPREPGGTVGGAEVLRTAQATQAAQEVRLVLQLTANALRRTEQVTMKAVFADEISPALRKVGVRFPKATRHPDGQGVEL